MNWEKLLTIDRKFIFVIIAIVIAIPIVFPFGLPTQVTSRTERLFDAVEIERPRDAQLWQAAAAAEILSWRHQVLTDLQHEGVLVLDSFPENLTAPLINQYLDLVFKSAAHLDRRHPGRDLELFLDLLLCETPQDLEVFAV